MIIETDNKSTLDIIYSCYSKRSREGEHFAPDHVLSYQIAGSLILNDGATDYPSTEGSFRFIRRNQLMKFVKVPPEHGEFKSISIFFSQKVLRAFSLEYGISAEHKPREKSVYLLKDNDLLKHYINSLLAYHNTVGLVNPQIIELKIKECLLLLLKAYPELKDILFDFSEPHKIDLEAFMNRNYHFNVQLKRFAYLTGRSLATFKRDFERVFNVTPSRWLLQKRLKEAYYLIKEKGKNASDIYLDLGFEDLSHFSFAFKKQFGNSPSKVAK